jgi:hypothetical protein
MTIHEGVNEMGYIMTNTTLNLCHNEFQEVREVERLEVTLTKYKIVYCESDRDAGPSISVPCLFTNVPGPFTSYGDIGPPHTYMDVTDLFSSWTS